MDSHFIERLVAAGVDPAAIGDPHTAWLRLAASEGLRATLVERYELEAHHRGITVAELPAPIRKRLSRQFLDIRFPGIELLGSDGGDPIQVVPYDAAWPKQFESWRNRIEEVLGPTAGSIEHVGSTGVPGLPAKAIIDIQVTVADLEDEARYAPQLATLGIPLRSRDVTHRYFRHQPDQPRVVHVHVAAIGSEWERRHLLFRDYLQVHDQRRDEYAVAKRELAVTFQNDRLAYTEGKTGFILDTLDLADSWADATGWTVSGRSRDSSY